MTTLNNKLKVEIFTLVKNESKILPLFIKHYRERFPGCVINVYDNKSTDDTVAICLDSNCKVTTCESYSEEILKNFKNTIWKTSEADWIIVCDADELLNISIEDIIKLPPQINVIHADYYNMVDINSDVNLESLDHGVCTFPATKCIMFKRTSISDINYSVGAHLCNPKPNAFYSEPVMLWHYASETMNYKNFRNNIELMFNAAGKVSDIPEELQWEAYKVSILDRAIKVK